MPLISIIIPVYNVEKFLDRCLNSVISQTFTDFEIILINDGSTDNSGAICDDWVKKDERIKAHHKINGGVADARNMALDLINGKYVIFIDSDDAVHPQLLEFLYKYIVDENADIAFPELQIFDTFEMPYCPNYNFDNISTLVCSKSKDGISKCISDYSVPIGGRLFKKEIFDNVRFKKYINDEDLQIIPHILGSSKFEKYVRCYVPLYFYYKSPEHISRSTTTLTVRSFDAFFVSYDLYRTFKKIGANELLQARAYRLFLKFVKSAVITNDNKKFRKLFIKNYFRYIFPILFMPNKHLNFNNKLICLSTIIPSKRLERFYYNTYRSEGIFNNMNELY